jgi:hypothetical protein
MPPARFTATAKPAKPAREPSAHERDGGFSQLERALASLGLSSKTTRLEAVGMLVVDVTGAQLKQLLDLPMLAAIRPNRTHHAPRKSATRAGN